MNPTPDLPRVGDRVVTARGPGVVIAVYRRSVGVWLDSGWHVHESWNERDLIEELRRCPK